LDPALIRPGRIDKQLELSHMVPEDVVRMLEHYYQVSLTKEDKERIRLTVTTKPALKLIPARVEQQAMEEETVEAMLRWLDEERCKIDPQCSITAAMSSTSSIDTVSVNTF